MGEPLTGLNAAEIDSLPFGYIAMKPDGTIVQYNRYEAQLARTDPADAIGKNFFRDVAPCTQVQDFEGRFREFAQDENSGPSLTFDFVFKFRHGLQNVRIGLVKGAIEGTIIVTVNRFQNQRASLEPGAELDAETGRLTNAAGARVVQADQDVWRAVNSVLEEISQISEGSAANRVGLQWGMGQALKVERAAQTERGQVLREMEFREVCALLSRSLAAIGLGRFEVDVRHRQQGVLVVDHLHSPFVEFFSEREAGSCDLLAGMYGGIFSYLSGRKLQGRELSCSQQPDAPCRFAVGTAERLAHLLEAADGSADAALLAELRPAS